MVAKEGNLNHVLLAVADVDEEYVDDGGGNLSHEENFFLQLPVDMEWFVRKNAIKAVLRNNFFLLKIMSLCVEDTSVSE